MIVDLEATCWENKKETSEVIEIGAIKIDKEGNKKEFQAFVRPIINPILSDFCKQLTGINQSDVDKAETFDKVAADFIEFVGTSRVYSWGYYDKNQLMKDCHRNKIAWQFDHTSLKHEFAKLKKIKPCGIIGALKMLDMSFEGAHHRGIDDVRNIFKVYKRIKESLPWYAYTTVNTFAPIAQSG